MHQWVRHGAVIVAVALALAYVGMVSVSREIRGFAPWPADLFWLAIVSFICGILLGLSIKNAFRAILLASVLAVVIFGTLWSYVYWVLVGDYIPLFDLIISDLVSLYVFQWGFFIFMVSALCGLIGTAVSMAVVSSDYLP
jgi:hypothetical protein